MISGYKINDNTLYVYLNYDYEFGMIDIRNKINDIEENIKNYIKKNKIIFRGTTIAIVVGGIVVGSIILNNDNNVNNNIENDLVLEYKVEDTNELEDTINIEIPEEIEEAVEEPKEEVNEIKKEEIYEKTVSKERTDSKLEKKEEQVIEKKEEVQELNTSVKEEIIEEVVDNNIYVEVKRSSGVVKLELEEYLIGCVGAEMPAAFNIEALKTQAIIARTYALKSIKTGKQLTDNEGTQSYKDNNELRSVWGSSFNTYYNKIKSAVESTKGMYLSYNGNYIEAVYHSTSNGRTEVSTNVWGNYYPYLVSVSSEYDSDSPTYIQAKYISYEELSGKLDYDVNIDTEINILSRTVGDRVEYISIGDKTYKGIDIRNKLGLRSNDYDIEKTDTGITFTTRGYGHGVGLSQYGANGMAKRGYSYIDIINHYYPGVSINNL